jgi:uncharacterized membrane protein YqjE
MPEVSGPAHSPADSGPMAAALRYLGSILRYFTALAGLAQTEAKEAAVIYCKVAVYLVLGLIFLIFGYIFFIIFVAFLLATVFGISWIWITLGLVVLHVALTVVCACSVRSGFRSPVFVATLAELRKDMEVMGAIRPGSTIPGSTQNSHPII